MFFIKLIVVISILLIIVKVYFKFTTGICKSSKHLVGKVVIITGANTGIGFTTAKNLAERGARVILACMNEDEGIKAVESIITSTGNRDVHYQHLDLRSLASVRAFADCIIKTEKHIDILINNAGIYEFDNVRTEDGLSLAMQTNYFGHFLLTSLLLPLLKASAPSRIITVSSFEYKRGKIDFDNLNNERDTDTSKTFFRHQVYRNTKLCVVLMTLELARRLEGTGVTANTLHPGAIATDMMKKSWLRHTRPLMKHILKTPWEGAQTTIFLAVSTELEGVSGKYFSDCKEEKITDSVMNEDLSRKLWEVSEKLVGLKN